MHNYTLEKNRAKSQDTSGQQNVILYILKHLFHTLDSPKEPSVARQGPHIHIPYSLPWQSCPQHIGHALAAQSVILQVELAAAL